MAMEYVFRGEYDIEVELTFFSSDEGGRRTGLPVQSDFDGPRLYLEGSEYHALLTLQDREWLMPGETARVFVTFSFPASLLGKLHPDQPFIVRKGYRPIGKGRILALLNFEKHVEETIRQEEERNARPSAPKVPPHWERPLHQSRKKKKKHL